MITCDRKGKRRGAQAAKAAGNAITARRPVRITAETPYGECSERLTAFGGLLALVKFLDLLEFEEAFAQHYVLPRRGPKLGDYRMVLGILLLLFIGFQPVPEPQRIRMPDHTVRIARLKMLYVAAKIRFHSNRDEVLYSVQEQRAAGLMDFLGYLDRRRRAA